MIAVRHEVRVACKRWAAAARAVECSCTFSQEAIYRNEHCHRHFFVAEARPPLTSPQASSQTAIDNPPIP